MNDAIQRALNAKLIAVVGLSKNPSKPSHEVASYLSANGFKIIPINPTADFILGEKSYNSLVDLPNNIKRELDVVDIFRRSEDVPLVVKEAAQIHHDYLRPSVVWMQLGIINETAVNIARAAGMAVVMDRCMKIEHKRMATKNSHL